jgi:hypothetical protein
MATVRTLACIVFRPEALDVHKYAHCISECSYIMRITPYGLVPTKISGIPAPLDYNVMNEKYLFGN